MTTHTMKMALADEDDMNVAYDLLGLLDSVERDYYPADDDDEDAPTHLDTDDIDHLRFFYNKLKAIVDRRGTGAMHRVIGGFSTVRYAKNQILDLTQDVVALHPRIVAALRFSELLGHCWEFKTSFDRKGEPHTIRATFKTTTITSESMRAEAMKLADDLLANVVKLEKEPTT